MEKISLEFIAKFFQRTQEKFAAGLVIYGTGSMLL